LPAGALCTFNPTSVTLDGTSSKTVTLTITTAANMALGSQTITVTGTSSGTGGASHTAPVNLTVTATTESFTLSSTNGVTFSVPVGGTAAVQLAVSSTTGFVNNNSTALPLTYTCSGLSITSEIFCQFTPSGGQSVTAATVTLNLVTTPRTVQLRRPFDRGSGMFYALLLPGVFGIVLVAGSRTRGLRPLSLLLILGCSTFWLGACGGSNNGMKNAGTPPSTYTVTVSTTTGGANPLTATSPTITLNVTAN
jgi:hypothetical protein